MSRIRPAIIRSTLIVFTALTARDLYAQCAWVERQEVIGTQVQELLGGTTAIDGDVAVLGAAPCRARVYRHDGSAWNLEQELVPATDTGSYGVVSLSGDVLVIGAWQDSAKTGAAFVYRFDGTQWLEEARLTASDGQVDEGFGFAVAVDGNLALIGTLPMDAEGAAYVFRFDGSTWVEEHKFVGDPNEVFFGYAVGLSGPTAAVGMAAGEAVHVYVHDGLQWSEQQRLVATDSEPGDDFGSSLSMRGSRILIGAPDDQDLGAYSGSAYLFQRTGNTWTQEQKLTAGDADIYRWFGESVALDGDDALIGTRGRWMYAFSFDSTTWVEEQRFTGSDTAVTGDSFGSGLCMDSGTALIGASAHDHGGSNAGAGYFFTTTAFALRVQPSPAQQGDLVRFTTSEGTPGTRAALAMVDANGLPTFLRIAIGVLDGAGAWEHQATVPAGVAGNTLGFRAFGTNACGSWMASSAQTLVLQ